MAIGFGIGTPRINIQSSEFSFDQALVRIAGGSALLFAGTILGLGLNYIYAIVLARMLGPEQFGLYALGLGCFNLLAFTALAGLDSAVLRFIPGLRTNGDVPEVAGIIRATLALAAGLGLLSAIALYATADSLAVRFFHRDDMAGVLNLFAFSIPFFVLSTVALAVLQAFREVRWRTLAKYLCEPVIKAAVTLGLIGWGWGLTAALIALPLALCVTTALALFPLRHLFSKQQAARPLGTSAGEVLTYSLPLLAGLLFNSAAARSDVLLLGIWSSVEDVGIYSAAFQTAASMALVLGTLESIATPFLSEKLSGNDPVQVRVLTGTLLRWTLMVTMPLCIVMTMFATDILSLFGSRFESGALCLVILAVGQFLYSVTGCSHGLLLWSGRSKLVMWNSIGISVVQIGLYILLIPFFGMLGAALASGGSLILSMIVRTVQVRRVLHIWPFDTSIWRPFAAGLGAAAPLLVVRALSLELPPLVSCGLFVILYAGLLCVFGLHDGDKAVLLHLRTRFGSAPIDMRRSDS